MVKTYITLIALALLATSCNSTRITNVWVPEDYQATPYERLMIVALTPTPGLRAQYENDFVDKLSNDGFLALASVNMVPDVNDIDRKTIQAWNAEYTLDGVIVTRVTDVKHEQEYIPPTTTLGGWYGAWAVPMSPGTVVENTTVSLETDLFDARSEKLVYSAVSKTTNPDDRTKAIHAVIDLLVADLTKRGYVTGK